MVYKWATGSRISADAQIAGEVCAELEARGALTAKNLLDESRPDDAPLHGAFEWDDGVAAEKYREDQARKIIHSIILIREETPTTRAFFHIERAKAEYKAIDTIFANPNDRKNLIDTISQELLAIRRKYDTVKEFESVWQAIDRVTVRDVPAAEVRAGA